jgi:hypothetical protein
VVTPWKLLLLPLVVLLPLVAYVAGTLSIGPEGPTRPEPVILRDADPVGNGATGEPRPRREKGTDHRRDQTAARGDDEESGDNGGDHGEDDDHGDETEDEDGPEVVLPPPTRIDDDGDDTGADNDGADDDQDDFEVDAGGGGD